MTSRAIFEDFFIYEMLEMIIYKGANVKLCYKE